ncbi:hypothetical protein BACCAC_00099 [Bacteroides caccae ATCC 43185]|nr:hypothetical protein BACCAC_00099 [Bacteroides caccae ATCC 43185]
MTKKGIEERPLVNPGTKVTLSLESKKGLEKFFPN